MSLYPKNLTSIITEVYNKAVENNDVIQFKSTSKYLKTSNSKEASMKYHLTFCDIDAQKPVKPEREDTVKTKFDPFIRDEPEFAIINSLMNDEYKLVLNKFPIVDEHLLLVTKKAIPQASLLTPNDLNASYQLLKALQGEDQDDDDDDEDEEEENAKPKSRHVIFYNCGENSGYSIDHKHLQCMKIPNKLKTFQDFVVQENPEPYIPNVKREALENEAVAFANFTIPLPKKIVDEEYLVMCYVNLLQRALSYFQQWEEADESKRLAPSYSFMMTTDWMSIVPRSSECADIEFEGNTYTMFTNALGYLHMLLFKGGQKELYDKLLEKKDSTPIEDFLLKCAFPNNFSAPPAESDY
ncbi:hypothetical protein HANVADRAFT_53168 [Hanseniaspora valbyensis NRRL Y-1626]|uniref:Uncharacterized protein n=1 Tax=Hanseniaspora valbyensis NRRL Y-1626 TaxID=766949 RepID=A0A1B7TCI2_9ASCO|nr:hypothetical protein HANVADRAFT_53168 [Hanseniaspora valbyensis NRRL Y-1626]